MRSYDTIIIDVGSESVRVGLLREKSGGGVTRKLLAVGHYDGVVERCMVNGDSYVNALSDALGEAVEVYGKKIKQVTVSLAGEFVRVRCAEACIENINEPINRSHIDALQELADKSVEYPPDYSYILRAFIDFSNDKVKFISNPLNMDTPILFARMCYFFADDNVMRLTERALAGVKNISYISADWAVAMDAFSLPERQSYIALADVGYMSTCVSIIKGNGLLDMATFSLGGAHITYAITELGFSPTEADAQKNAFNLRVAPSAYEQTKTGGNSVALTDIDAAVKGALDVISEGIKSILDTSEVAFTSAMPLYVIGGGVSSVTGVSYYLENKLGRRVELLGSGSSEYSSPIYTSFMCSLNVAAQNAEKPKSIWSKLLRR